MDVLNGNIPKHSNLTGGKSAYVGGQLWFADTVSMFVSGGSGRFPPLDEEQLVTAVEVFSSFSYAVTAAAQYLHCSKREFVNSAKTIRELHSA